MCYFFSVNKKLFHSVRSTVSLRAQRGNLPEGIPHCNDIKRVVRNNASGLVVAFVAKYERYIVAHDAKEFQKTFRLGHGKVARQYRRNGQGKICEFNDVEPRKFHKSFYVFVWKLVRNGENGTCKMARHNAK